MCHGHPRTHPCSHMSVKWLYCPKAGFDPATGLVTPCRNPEYYPTQSIKLNCSLQNCAFKTLGGAWICCQCEQGPNHLGWCTASSLTPGQGGRDWQIPNDEWSFAEHQEPCGHGCCENCLPFDATGTDGLYAETNGSSSSHPGKPRKKNKSSSYSKRTTKT